MAGIVGLPSFRDGSSLDHPSFPIGYRGAGEQLARFLELPFGRLLAK
jgi:hypothetical protein